MPQKCFRAGVMFQVCQKRADLERQHAIDAVLKGATVPDLQKTAQTGNGKMPQMCFRAGVVCQVCQKTAWVTDSDYFINFVKI